MDISSDNNDCVVSFGLGGWAASTHREDRISPLPEYILGHILSFLPTIEAVRASILSQRWRYLWKSINSLVFDLDQIQHRFEPLLRADASFILSEKRRWKREEEKEKVMNNQVINFLNKVLILFQDANIHKVSLRYTPYLGQQIKVWNYAIFLLILASVTHKAKEIDLCLDPGIVARLPLCFFTNKYLGVLKLTLNDRQLELPAKMGFARLRTMHLVSVLFYDENLTRQLFSSSPVLEDLVIKKCSHRPHFGVLEVSSLSLKRLVIEIGLDLDDDLSSCEFKLSTPRLEFFSYEGFAARDYTLGQLSSIKCASICCFIFCWRVQHDAELMSKVLDGLRKVEVLKICGLCIKALLPPPDSLECFYTPFHHLRHLELSLKFFGKSLPAIINILNTSPGLRTLVINLQVPGYGCEEYHNYECGCFEEVGSELIYKPSEDEKNREEYYLGVLKLFSGHRLQNLRKVEMRDIVGELELEFLKYLLKTQMFLESMTISLFHNCRIRHLKIDEELLGFPRASPSLAVLLLHSL